MRVAKNECLSLWMCQWVWQQMATPQHHSTTITHSTMTNVDSTIAIRFVVCRQNTHRLICAVFEFVCGISLYKCVRYMHNIAHCFDLTGREVLDALHHTRIKLKIILTFYFWTIYASTRQECKRLPDSISLETNFNWTIVYFLNE